MARTQAEGDKPANRDAPRVFIMHLADSRAVGGTDIKTGAQFQHWRNKGAKHMPLETPRRVKC